MRFTLSNKIVQIAFAHSPFRHPAPEPAVYDKDGKRVLGRVHRVRSTTAKISLLLPADLAYVMDYAEEGKNGKVFLVDGKEMVQIVLATATAKTSPRDQFCRRIGRRAAVGKAISALISGIKNKYGSVKEGVTVSKFVTDGNLFVDKQITEVDAKELFKQL